MKKFRNEGGVAIAAAPLFSEKDNDDFPMQSDNNRHNYEIPTRPGRPSPAAAVVVDSDVVKVQRPLAVRAPGVVRPIPRRAAQEFYKAVEHLPFAQVHQAVLESHEWHRVYTSNDPDPHQQLSSNSPDSFPDNVVMHGYIANRENGARNPSPGTRVVDERKKRLRLSESISDVSSSSSDEGDSPAVAPLVVLKPIAVRIARPKAMRVAASATSNDSNNNNNAVPSDISIAERSLSPLTLGSAHATAEKQQHHRAPINIIEEDNCYVICARTTTNVELPILSAVQEARDGILHALAISGGDTDSTAFTNCLDVLSQYYQDTCTFKNSDIDASMGSEGMWLTLTKPTFFGNLGDNDQGDPMYTLSRMSFGMFEPGALVCSLQGNFNSVQEIEPTEDMRIPKSLRDEVTAGSCVLRTYNVVTAFTIEPSSAAYPEAPNADVHRPIRGIMTTYGYMIADPGTSNRHSVWITGGRIDPNDSPQDQEAWKRLFTAHPPKYGMAAHARLLAVKLLMGAVVPETMDPETGSMEYTFTRPIGGHGLAYIDTLYVDDSLRIVRGHRGTLFVFSRMPDSNQQS